MMKLDKRFSGKLTIEVVEAHNGIDDKGNMCLSVNCDMKSMGLVEKMAILNAFMSAIELDSHDMVMLLALIDGFERDHGSISTKLKDNGDGTYTNVDNGKIVGKKNKDGKFEFEF